VPVQSVVNAKFRSSLIFFEKNFASNRHHQRHRPDPFQGAIVLVRRLEGTVFALEDRCAHRQVPLSKGAVDGCTVRCGYHGWCYDTSGKCNDVPYLGRGKLPNGVRAYPCGRHNYRSRSVGGTDRSAVRVIVSPETGISHPPPKGFLPCRPKPVQVQVPLFSMDVPAGTSCQSSAVIDLFAQLAARARLGLKGSYWGGPRSPATDDSQLRVASSSSTNPAGRGYPHGSFWARLSPCALPARAPVESVIPARKI
jgi:nitrite reductase/ring-hydroxylating ferredoxin subunit